MAGTAFISSWAMQAYSSSPIHMPRRAAMNRSVHPQSGLLRRHASPAASGWLVKSCVAISAAIAFEGGAYAAVNINQQGLTGAWANAATSGQGMVIELYPDLLSAGTGYIFGTWYTFDTTAGGADHNRWFTYQASVSEGASEAEVNIYQSIGGTFAALGGTATTPIGTGTISFDSCTTGSFTFAFDDGRAGTIPLGRIMRNAACVDAVDPPPSIDGDFGLSGAWADMSTSAQGMVIEVNAASSNVFLGWFTYSADGTSDVTGQRWFTAQHPYTPGERSMVLDVYQTTGGIFNKDAATSTVPVGTATLTYTSCMSADFDYAFTGGDLEGRSGTLHLSRIARMPPNCAF
jgi:hypothetical protein